MNTSSLPLRGSADSIDPRRHIPLPNMAVAKQTQFFVLCAVISLCIGGNNIDQTMNHMMGHMQQRMVDKMNEICDKKAEIGPEMVECEKKMPSQMMDTVKGCRSNCMDHEYDNCQDALNAFCAKGDPEKRECGSCFWGCIRDKMNSMREVMQSTEMREKMMACHTCIEQVMQSHGIQ